MVEEGASVPSPQGSSSSWEWNGWVRKQWEDQWILVLLVWMATWLVMACWVERHAIGLPYMDEHVFFGIATGQEPLTWKFLFTPQNEHRQPLTRLQIVLFGRLCGWNYRHILQCNLAILALGVLALLVAARSIRGQAYLADSFLCLVVLHPWAFETIVLWCYSFLPTLSLFCIALAMLGSGFALKNPIYLLLYFITSCTLVFGGGPPGQFWAIGMCGVLLTLWIKRKPLGWQVLGGMGVLITLVSAILFLAHTPHLPTNDCLRPPTWGATALVTCKHCFAWLGRPILNVTWPWIAFVLTVPVLYLLYRMARDLRGFAGGGGQLKEQMVAWLDLSWLLITVIAVTAALAYGRGATGPWASRYHVLVAPVALVLYLLLLRVRSGPVFPGLLCLLMAVSYGWCWPQALFYTHSRHTRGLELVQRLRQGWQPLMTVVREFSGITWPPLPFPQHYLLHDWIGLRKARISVFRRMPEPDLSHAFLAHELQRSASVLMVNDASAVGGRAIRAQRTKLSDARVFVPFHLPRRMTCRVFARVFAKTSGQSLMVQIDDRPARTVELPSAPGYNPVPLLTTGTLGPGSHKVSVAFFSPETLIDVIEIVPARE